MANMIVRNIPDDVHRRLKILAAERGTSAEAVVREMIADATRPSMKLGDAVAAFARRTGEDFPKVERKPDTLRPATFE
ncbi:FitA-like ribbon-helix-helix domain-containing protein [Pelagibacterium halotolerans]|uniref:FitA-like ribbon-helix-helix domain-containing protein n=1 Tax=Pelagibacterium halotolerans TaxID=531813 RepID=UPI003850654F